MPSEKRVSMEWRAIYEQEFNFLGMEIGSNSKHTERLCKSDGEAALTYHRSLSTPPSFAISC